MTRASDPTVLGEEPALGDDPASDGERAVGESAAAGGAGGDAGDPASGEEDAVGRSADAPWWWHLGRASAWALAVLVPVQFAATRLGEDPGRLTVPLARERWETPAFRLLDAGVFALAGLHVVVACASAVVRADAAGRSAWWRTAALVVAATAAATAAAFGVFVASP